MDDVKLLARWSGWCDPCATERPLVLTETGQRGVRAWLSGIGAEDRTLTLTCRVCGQWQLVPLAEDDLAEDDLADIVMLAAVSPAALGPVGARQVIVRSACTPYPLEPVPAPRRPEPPITARVTSKTMTAADDIALDLLAEGLDLVAASPR